MRSQPLIIGCAFTGARFMRHDSRPDFRATHMPLSPRQNIAEAIQAYALGARHLHFHARNHITGEQFADVSWYQEVCQGVRDACPNAVISFGSSRKGDEVLQAIEEQGEMARCAGLDACPDFFTNFAAVEITMFEPPENREITDNLHPTNIRQHYTTTIAHMKELGATQEVEVTTAPKSLQVLEQIKADPRFELLFPLNIVILLGFSAGLPITREAYEESVERAHRLLEGGRGTIMVGTVIRPTESLDLDPTIALDWCLEDDRVTAFRTGIEDSPALGGEHKTNPELVEYVTTYCRQKGVPILTDPMEVRKTMHLSAPSLMYGLERAVGQ